MAAALERFRLSAGERIARLNLAWIRFEQLSDRTTAVADIERDLHSLKGDAALAGFAPAAQVCHGLEDLAHAIATGSNSAAAAELGDLALRGLDLVAELIDETPTVDSALANHWLADARTALEDASTSTAVREPASLGATVGRDRGPRAPEIRISAGQLDRMRDLIGELLLTRLRVGSSAAHVAELRAVARSGIAQELRTVESSLSDDAHRMANLVRALDDLTRTLRTVPIGTLFERYPRAVRDLARDLGKHVRLECEGEAVKVDRDILEAIAEPLLHLVRNAVDHGLEPPTARTAAGKPPEARLRLRAAISGGALQVTVSDDGRGIDPTAVRRRAAELGFVSAVVAEALTDERALQLLFETGMTTRREVTQISGRGVGLDVVQRTVEAVGGSVSVSSTVGVGTTFWLEAPIGAAITSVVLFRVGAGVYALPTANVATILDAADYPLRRGRTGPVIDHRGAPVRVVSLARHLAQTENIPIDADARTFMVVNAGDRMAALSDAREHLQRDAVLQPAGAAFAHDRMVTSVVGLESGAMAPVLSPGELVRG